MKKLLCRQNWKPRLPTAHKMDDFQAVGLAEHGLGKMLAGQNFSIAFNHHPCCVMPARGQQIGHAARCSKGFGFPVDCDIHTRLQKKTATGVFSQFEGVMACGDAGRQKNTRKTITAAGEHNPAKKQVGPASLRRYYPRQVQNRVFLCDSRGQGAITLSQPFMAPPAGSRTLGLAHKECKQNRVGFCPLRAMGWCRQGHGNNKVLAPIHEKGENFHIAAGGRACRPGIFGNRAKHCTTAQYRVCVQ